ncbi:pre-mRNA-splicing factor SLT11 [Candida albicans P76067]|nr:pre-mRNA-splicing factor SLT11 [Candida albicans P76055]KHC38919.1 pre-mRNA-splicing factor SLT11 [Candida albicans P76067]KHC65015.1 pre-mRNA-splicing factor SLT11 [Candida albicans P75010]
MSTDIFSICAKCLGNESQIKMIKQVNGDECRQCTRPYTIYRWGNRKQGNKTIICITCARARHCCQSCLLDITYGIPTDLRDTALEMAGLEPLTKSANPTNREVKAIMADKLETKFKEQQERSNDILSKLAEKLNKPEEKKTEVAIDVAKLAKKLPFGNSLDVQKYPDMTTFFVFGFSSDFPQAIFSRYAEQYGKVESVVFSSASGCGFIRFEKVSSAVGFAKSIAENGLNKNKSIAGLLILENTPMRVCFGKQKPLPRTAADQRKLNTVVTKVMKQLVSKSKVGVVVKTKPNVYKALSEDYEE